MKQLKYVIAFVVALVGLAASAQAASAAYVTQSAPNSTVGITQYAYAAGSGGSPSTGNLPWVYLDIFASDSNRHANTAWSWTVSNLGQQVQWDDGSALGATEKIDHWTDLRVRFQLGTGKPQGTYTTGFKADTTAAVGGAATNNPYTVPVKLVVEPVNQCTDRLDNDGDGKRDYRVVPGTNTPVDPDCSDMNDVTEGGGAPTPPAAPTNLAASCGDGQATVSWNDNATTETDYVVRYRVNGTSTWTDTTAAQNDTSKIVTGLTNGTAYEFGVGARNAASTTFGTSPGALVCAPQGGAGGGLPPRWDPAANTTWQWTIGQRETRLNLPVAAYDIDWQQTTVADVSTLHANGKKVICYFNAGAYQPGQPDEAQWTEAMKGSGVEGWPGEFWADIRRADVRAIMAARIQTCKDKGFDAIEPDNQDGFDNPSGFPLTAADQLDYNRFLATTAHQKGLAAFLKNDVGQTAAGAGGLRDWYDGAINEQCWTYDECNVYDGWVASGRPVLQVEYSDDAPGKPANWCDLANTAGFRSALATLDLSGTPWTPCWSAGTPIDTGGTTTAGP